MTNVVTISSAAGIRDFDICFSGLGLKKGKHHTGHGGMADPSLKDLDQTGPLTELLV